MTARTWIRHIEHYNCERLRSSSYFVQGFIDLAKERGFRFEIINGPPPADFPDLQPHGERSPFGVFRLVTQADDFFFCIDGRDDNAKCRRPYLEGCRYYFKVNYNEAALARNTTLRSCRARILPANPHFPIRVTRFESYVPRLHPSPTGLGPVIRHNWRRIAHWRSTISIQDIVSFRTCAKSHDLTFVVPYYAQSHHRELNEYRYEVMRAIRARFRSGAVVGFVGNEVPDRYSDFRIPALSSIGHLRRMAGSRVLVYARGAHGCISYKFGEMLALGSPILGQSLLNNADSLMRHDYFAEQFVYDDPDEIALASSNLLAQPERVRAIGASNARIFDEHFAPRAAAAKILESIAENERIESRTQSLYAARLDGLGAT